MKSPDTMRNSIYHNISEIMSYMWGIIPHPVKTTSRLLQEEKKVIYGFLFILIFSSLYTLYVAVLYVVGLEPYYWEPLLRIPLEKWYLWQTFITIPITISTWIVLAGCIQLLSKPFKGT